MLMRLSNILLCHTLWSILSGYASRCIWNTTEYNILGSLRKKQQYRSEDQAGMSFTVAQEKEIPIQLRRFLSSTIHNSYQGGCGNRLEKSVFPATPKKFRRTGVQFRTGTRISIVPGQLKLSSMKQHNNCLYANLRPVDNDKMNHS